MEIKSFTFNAFQENTYIIYDDTKECIIIDPGCYEKKEKNILEEFINNKKLKPVKLINTHCHIDHILGNQFVFQKWNLDTYMNKKDTPLLENAETIASMYGFTKYENCLNPKKFLEDKDVVNFGINQFEILFTPGHSPGHICLYSKKHNVIIAGDVIFRNSIGRTDLPGGDYTTLMNSITKQILPLPDTTKIYCGHGPCTDLGFERKNNPFLQ